MTLTADTRPDRYVAPTATSPDEDLFDLDITVFESGTGLDEIIRMTDDGCGSTCASACNSCA